MRSMHKFMVVLGVTAVAVGLSLGQPGGGGRRGGGFGGGGTNNPATLINMDAVKKELKLTDEQLAKVPDAVWKALGEVLTPEQQKRLRQISLQLRGPEALADAKVQTALKLNEDQKDAIKSALDAQKKELEDLRAEGFGPNMFQKMQEIRKGTTEKVTGVLSAGQKKQWSEMVGEEFKMPQFGGFGKGGKGGKGKGGFKKKQKTDAE